MQSCSQVSDDVEKHKKSAVINNQKVKLQDENVEDQISYGDLYVIGRIWIEALQKGLVGTNGNMVPVVKASAKLQITPQKPPKMKYTDLPIYESPHKDYKEYIDEKDIPAERNVKILQQYLLPYVKKYRKMAIENLCKIGCEVKRYFVYTGDYISKSKSDFKATMRDPDNLAKRQAVVGAGTLTGYFAGGGGGLPRRIFSTSVGFFSTGALCFPKETDEIFRNISSLFGKGALAVYRWGWSSTSGMKEKIPCEIPPQPPERKLIDCPPKK